MDDIILAWTNYWEVLRRQVPLLARRLLSRRFNNQHKRLALAFGIGADLNVASTTNLLQQASRPVDLSFTSGWFKLAVMLLLDWPWLVSRRALEATPGEMATLTGWTPLSDTCHQMSTYPGRKRRKTMLSQLQNDRNWLDLFSSMRFMTSRCLETRMLIVGNRNLKTACRLWVGSIGTKVWYLVCTPATLASVDIHLQVLCGCSWFSFHDGSTITLPFLKIYPLRQG